MWALPTSKSIGSMLAFVPGAVSPANGVDSGGSKGEQSVRISVFGARPNDQRQMTNGLLYTNLNGDGGGRLYFVNPVTDSGERHRPRRGRLGAVSDGGAVVNTIPREGGNRFSGTGFGAYTNHNLQASNLSDDLKAWGLTVVNGVRNIYDSNGLFGGPIVKDKWWFVTSGRRSGSTLRAASLFHDASASNPTGSTRPTRAGRSIRWNTTATTSSGRRSSVQEGQVRRLDRHPAPLPRPGVRAARSGHRARRSQRRDVPQRFADAVHVEPAAVEQLLFEGGGSISLNAFGTANFGTQLDGSDYEECGRANRSGSTSRTRRAGANYHGVGAIGIGISNLFVGRFATSYVTGAHNFKTGLYSFAATSPATPSTGPTTWPRPADLLHVHQRRADALTEFAIVAPTRT